MKSRKRRLLEAGPIIKLFAIIAAIAAMAIAMFVYFSFMRPATGRADISALVVAEGSPDGSTATFRITLQNAGDAVGRVYWINIHNLGGGAPTVQAVAGNTTFLNVTTISSFIANYTTAMPATGVDVAAQGTAVITIRVTGTGLFPGTPFRLYIFYYDMARRTATHIEAPVSLR